MLTDDTFNAVPADAACERCRNFAISKSGKMYCEFLDQRVQRLGWCPDFELPIMDQIRQNKAARGVENT